MTRDTVQRAGIGWLIDGSGTGICKDVVLEIEKFHIRSVHKAERPLEDYSLDINLCGYTVLPMLVDSHVHLTWSGTSDQDRRTAQLNPSYETACKTIKRHLKQHIECGIVAVRDGGDRNGYTLRFKQSDEFICDKDIQISAAGAAWHAPGRYGRLIGTAPAQAQLLPETMLSLNHMGDHIKLVNSGLNSLKVFGKQTPAQFDATTLKKVVEIAHANGRRVMVHANGQLPVQSALVAGCDSIEHGFFMGPETLAMLADSGATWVPTAVTMHAYARQLPAQSREAKMAHKNLEHQLAQLALARKLGVRVAAGTDAGSLGVHHGFALAEEIKLLMTAGYPIDEAVACASHNGMRLLSLSGQGLLAAGNRADFIAIKGSSDRVAEGLVRPDRIYIGGLPKQPTGD